MPVGMYICILICFFVIAVVAIKRNVNYGKLLRMAVSACFVIVCTMFLYAPNIMADIGGGLYHADAYCNSIINVLYGAPYDKFNTSIYGHYGLFYFLPVSVLRLFGVNRWIAITASIALFGLITFSCEMWIFNKLIKNDAIFILAVLANAVVNTQIYPGVYYQVMPHRILFPVLILTYILKMQIDQKELSLPLWILSTLAIIWNLETGLVCLLVVSLYCMYSRCKKQQKISFIKWFLILAEMLASIAAAYILVNIYNCACGGSWNFVSTFIYPIASAEYHVEDLWLPLGTPFLGYYIVVILFAGIICYYSVAVCSLSADDKTVFIVLTAVMGLGVFTYFMNRAASTNAAIAGFEVTLALSVLLDNHMPLLNMLDYKRIHSNHSLSIYLIGLIIMVSMNISTLGSVGNRISSYYSTVFKSQVMYEAVQELRSVLPEDDSDIAYISMPIISSILERDPKIYAIDFPDMNPQGIEYITESLTEYRYFCVAYLYDTETPWIEYIQDLNYIEIWSNGRYYLYEKVSK